MVAQNTIERTMTQADVIRVRAISRSAVFPSASFLFPGMFLLLRLQGLQVVVQPIETLLPEPPILIEAIRRLLQRLSLQLARPPLSLPSPHNEPGLLQHLEMS